MKMNFFSSSVFCFLCLIQSITAHAQSCDLEYPRRALNYSGEFVLVQSDNTDCDKVFNERKYRATFNFTGDIGDQGMLSFQTDKPDAFLRNVTFVGVMNYRCDMAADKTIINRDKTTIYMINAATVSRDVLFSKVTVQIKKGGAVLCTAAAEFTGKKY